MDYYVAERLLAFFFICFFFVLGSGDLLNYIRNPPKEEKDSVEDALGITAKLVLYAVSFAAFLFYYMSIATGNDPTRVQRRVILGLLLCTLAVLPIAVSGKPVKVERDDIYRTLVPFVATAVSNFFVV